MKLRCKEEKDEHERFSVNLDASPGGRSIGSSVVDSCAIGIMAKAPRPGYSKTRLCPPLAPDQAAALSGAFLRDTTESLAAAALTTPIVGYAAYAPSGAETAVRAHLAPGTRCLLADGATVEASGVEGFGRCLLHAVESMFARGHVAACVLSADTPTLPTAILVKAARLLLEADTRRVVLGSCDDGGYYLLGMRQVYSRLFADIGWSTETVADTTRTRAAELGLAVVELPCWQDVDDAATLMRLFHRTDGYEAPHTRDMIRRLALDPLLTE